MRKIITELPEIELVGIVVNISNALKRDLSTAQLASTF